MSIIGDLYEQDILELQRQIQTLTVERDKAVADLEQLKKNLGIDKCDLIFCEDPACPKNNPRT